MCACMCMCVHVGVCVRAFVHACVCVCVPVSVCVSIVKMFCSVVICLVDCVPVKLINPLPAFSSSQPLIMSSATIGRDRTACLKSDFSCLPMRRKVLTVSVSGERPARFRDQPCLGRNLGSRYSL